MALREKVLKLANKPGIFGNLQLRIEEGSISKPDIEAALRSECMYAKGEFWDVLIPPRYPFVFKLARKPSVEFFRIVGEDEMLLKKYIGEFIPAQQTFRAGCDILMLQQKIEYPFQISSGSFKRTVSTDVLMLKAFLISRSFRSDFVRLIRGIELLHKETGKIIDLWGSGNLVFTYPWKRDTAKIIDTNFLFWKIEGPEESQSRNQKMMNQGYSESVFCLKKIKGLLKYDEQT